jgi:hypothetical protein
MLKGLHKQVVVLSDLEGEIFDQAIFIVRSGYPKFKGQDREKALKEAGRIVENYLIKYAPDDSKLGGALKLKEKITIKNKWVLWIAAGFISIALSITFAIIL